MNNNQGLLMEFVEFMIVRKKWWLLPALILLLFVAALIIFGQSSAVSPFIYALG